MKVITSIEIKAPGFNSDTNWCSTNIKISKHPRTWNEVDEVKSQRKTLLIQIENCFNSNFDYKILDCFYKLDSTTNVKIDIINKEKY